MQHIVFTQFSVLQLCIANVLTEGHDGFNRIPEQKVNPTIVEVVSLHILEAYS